jgi:putative aldouronate transport system substrate-binding protein
MKSFAKQGVRILLFISAILTLVFIFWISQRSKSKSGEIETIKIAIPYCDTIESMDTNYYKTWLEQKMHVSIEFVYIRESYTNEYLRLMFNADNSDIDAVLFSPDSGSVSVDDINEYGEKGYLLAIDNYCQATGTNLDRLFSETTDFNLKEYMTGEDGHIYYFPNYEDARQSKTAQVLWMNQEWLKALNLRFPQTTEEFRSVLHAFSENDPNGNGLPDEIPFISCEAENGFQGYHFLMNAFVYNDPQNAYFYASEDTVSFAPVLDEWREALAYCADLYKAGLLVDRSFTYSQNQFIQIVNDKNNVVGAFTSGASICEVVNEASVEILNRYVAVTPLSGPKGVRFAAERTNLPTVGAVITSQCSDPDTVYALLDLMLSEEASLIFKYGEQGVDWEYGRSGDISQYGESASIYLIHDLSGVAQNSNFSGYGPAAVPNVYLDGITWNGIQTDQNYIDARASLGYEAYYPEFKLGSILALDAATLTECRAISNYAHEQLVRYITGNADIRDDTQWEEYLEGYAAFPLESTLSKVRRMMK